MLVTAHPDIDHAALSRDARRFVDLRGTTRGSGDGASSGCSAPDGGTAVRRPSSSAGQDEVMKPVALTAASTWAMVSGFSNAPV